LVRLSLQLDCGLLCATPLASLHMTAHSSGPHNYIIEQVDIWSSCLVGVGCVKDTLYGPRSACGH
jgi:hypothetical protein